MIYILKLAYLRREKMNVFKNFLTLSVKILNDFFLKFHDFKICLKQVELFGVLWFWVAGNLLVCSQLFSKFSKPNNLFAMYTQFCLKADSVNTRFIFDWSFVLYQKKIIRKTGFYWKKFFGI